jgi:predicted permease
MELRHGLRALTKSRGIACSAVLALALGIGATTTMFSVTHGLLGEMPFEEAHRLVYLGIDQATARRFNQYQLSVHELTEWREQQSTLEDLAGFYAFSLNMSGTDGRPERVEGALVTANAFDVLRARPLIGRGFGSEEDRPGAHPVVILGYALWANHYGLDPNVLGRTVRVNGIQRTVIGVMPEGFRFPYGENLWLPLEIDPTAVERGSGRWIRTFGRLTENASLADAKVEFAGLARRLELAYPETYAGIRMLVIPYKDHIAEMDPDLIRNLMLGAVSLVLIIACANVANLLLARAAVRSREVAVRTALGASRLRVIGQLLAEALLLSMFGGIAGVGLAYVSVAAINAPAVMSMPYYWMDIRVDGAVLLFAFALVLFSSLIAGTVPAFKASGVNVNDVLKDKALGVTGLRLGRFSRSLVVCQIALSCGLLSASWLMVKEVSSITADDLRFANSNVLTARTTLLQADYPDDQRRERFFSDLVSQLEGRPEVNAAAVVSHLPGVSRWRWRLQNQGVVYDDYRDLPLTQLAVVSPGFFGALGVGLLEGRDFTPYDNANSVPVAIVNHQFADRYFTGESPLGRQIRTPTLNGEGDWMTIVGVVPNLAMNYRTLTDADGMYVPYSQRPLRSMSVIVRSRRDPMTLVRLVRDAVTTIDPHLPIYDVNSLAMKISELTYPAQMFGAMFFCFGIMAVALAVVGLYGVTAFLVRRRTREIGIRMALGARTNRILFHSLRVGLAQLSIGLGAGLCLALLVSYAISQVPLNTDPWDWKVYLPIALTLGITGIIASIVPAVYATRVDPMKTLRYE